MKTPTGRTRPRAVLITAAALVAVLVASLATASPTPAAEGPGAGAARHFLDRSPLKVMTRNVYLGADLSPALEANSLPEAFAAANEILIEVDRTNFPERAVPLAREIHNARPHLVGLQEVALWRTQTPSDLGAPPAGIGQPATDVRYDFLALLMDELDKLGGRYRVVAVNEEFDIEMPVDQSEPPDGIPELDGRLTMRDVVLKRKGAGVKTDKVEMGHFENRYTANVGGIPIAVDRGWISLNGQIRNGRKFRFANTHLEAFGDPEIREAQAMELYEKGGPLRGKQRVVLVGDINSGNAADRVFGEDQLAFKALKNDFGLRVRSADFTCCYPSALDDPGFIFDHTVDHVMTRPAQKLRRSYVTGNDPGQMTPSGLWPSDHGGAFSRLFLKN